jgi:hypothetical protein
MSSAPMLSDTDRQLLIEMFCCVVAADKRISGTEIQAVADVFASRGESVPDKQVIIDCCKSIHKSGLEKSLARIAERAKSLAGTAAAEMFTDAQADLIGADGESTSEEVRISQSLVAALQSTDGEASETEASDILLEDPTATAGASMLATARSSASLAGAAAERTKLTTMTLPSAFVELGKYCIEKRSHETAFATIFAAIDKLHNEMKETTGKISKAAVATTFAGKAQELAGKGVQVAFAQKQKMQLQKLQHDLGKAVFEAKGMAGGPKEIVGKIQNIKQRLEGLATTVTTSSRELKGSAAQVGRSAIQAAAASAETTWSPFSWSKKKIAAVAVAGFLGLSFIGSWIDKPDGGLTTDAEESRATSAGGAVSAIDKKKVQAKADLVKNGMEFFEVTKLLGKPEERTDVKVKGSPEQTICWWMNGSLSVTFTKSLFGPIGGKVTQVLVGQPGYETAGSGLTVMQQRGRGGPGADRAVQNLINSGNYTREAEENIRGVMEAAQRIDGRK